MKGKDEYQGQTTLPRYSVGNFLDRVVTIRHVEELTLAPRDNSLKLRTEPEKLIRS